MSTVADTLFAELERRGTDILFGIPGVHTVELYRSLAATGIRHVTPRHEQGAGFMADGYARVSGKPGVALVITGPGLTNTLTPMAQARADSVPMLVLSAVNETHTLGKGIGHLHELPDQHALASQVALISRHLARADQLEGAISDAFRPFTAARPGPTHIQIPLDLAGASASAPWSLTPHEPPEPTVEQVARAAEMLSQAERPVILAGGGARHAGSVLQQLSEKLNAPVVQSVNARGILFGHPLGVPASPSLKSVRAVIEQADIVLALGTEIGPTDYDIYATGTMATMNRLIRVDICPERLRSRPCELGLLGEASEAVSRILAAMPSDTEQTGGAERAEAARSAAWEEIGPEYQAQVRILEAIRDAVPRSILVGDSTQLIYAGNLYYDHDRPGGWFNAATGYGALGYGIPAAIGASIADPETPVIALLGDGGAQFTLPEIMTAMDEKLPVTFVIWNNAGYLEIARAMKDAGVPVIGCAPSPPDFERAAASFGLPYRRCMPDAESIAEAVACSARLEGPSMVEIDATRFSPVR